MSNAVKKDEKSKTILTDPIVKQADMPLEMRSAAFQVNEVMVILSIAHFNRSMISPL